MFINTSNTPVMSLPRHCSTVYRWTTKMFGGESAPACIVDKPSSETDLGQNILEEHFWGGFLSCRQFVVSSLFGCCWASPPQPQHTRWEFINNTAQNTKRPHTSLYISTHYSRENRKSIDNIHFIMTTMNASLNGGTLFLGKVKAEWGFIEKCWN